MVEVSTCYISAGCNNSPHVADWGKNGLVCYGSCNSVAIYQPQVTNSEGKTPASILCTSKGHKAKVNCARWIKTSKELETEIVSGSVDKTAIVWKYKNQQCVSSQILSGHNGSVNVVAALEVPNLDITSKSENSQPGNHTLIVTSSSDSTAIVWHRLDSEDFENIQTVSFKNGFALDVSLISVADSSGVLLAFGCDDQKVHLYVWQSTQFIPSLSLSGHEDWVRGVQFCMDDKRNVLLSSCGQDFVVRIWRISPRFQKEENDILQEMPAQELPLNETLKMKEKVLNFFSKGIEQSYAVTLESVLQGHDGWIYSIHWHPIIKTENGYHQPMKLLTASMDKTMIIWAPDEQAGVWVEQIRVGEVGGNTLGLYGGLFGPEGNTILAHGYQGALHQWSLDEKQNWVPSVTSGGHFKGVEDIAWDPVGGNFLISVSLDQTCRLHAPYVNPEQKLTWYEIARPQVHGYDLQAISMLHRYKFISAADEKVLRVFDAPRNFIENFCNITQLDFEKELSNKEFSSVPEGASVPALGLSNKAVYQEKEEIKENHERTEPHPNELYPEVYFASLTLYEPPTEEHLLQNTLWPETQKLYGHGYEVFSIACDPQGEFLASACKASKSEYAGIILWDCKQWTQLGTLTGATLTVTQLAFSHDGCYLLSVSRDRTWTLYRRTQDADVPFKIFASVNKKTTSHSRVIWACCWSHDDNYFLTASRDKKVIAWKCPSHKESSPPENVGNVLLPESVTAVDMAPTLTSSQKYLVSVGLESGLIYLYQWSPDSPEIDQWEQLTVLDLISPHLTVKRLMFRQQEGILGDQNSEQNTQQGFQLASCSEDHSVRIINIRLKTT